MDSKEPLDSYRRQHVVDGPIANQSRDKKAKDTARKSTSPVRYWGKNIYYPNDNDRDTDELLHKSKECM